MVYRINDPAFGASLAHIARAAQVALESCGSQENLKTLNTVHMLTNIRLAL